MTDSAGSRGILIVVLAGVIWSLQGVTIRMVEEANGSQIIFWRGVSQLITLLILVAIINRGRMISAFRRAGKVGIIGGLCQVVASSCFVFGLMQSHRQYMADAAHDSRNQRMTPNAGRHLFVLH